MVVTRCVLFLLLFLFFNWMCNMSILRYVATEEKAMFKQFNNLAMLHLSQFNRSVDTEVTTSMID